MPSRYMLKGTSILSDLPGPPASSEMLRRTPLPLILAAGGGEPILRSSPLDAGRTGLDEIPFRPSRPAELEELLRREFQPTPKPWGRGSIVTETFRAPEPGSAARYSRYGTVRVVGGWVFRRLGGFWSPIFHAVPLGVGTPRRGDPAWFPDGGDEPSLPSDIGLPALGEPFAPSGVYREPMWLLPPLTQEEDEGDYSAIRSPGGSTLVGPVLPPSSVIKDFDLGKWRQAARRSYLRQVARSQAIKAEAALQQQALERSLEQLQAEVPRFIPGATVQPPNPADYYTLRDDYVWNPATRSYERVQVREPDTFRYEQARREWQSNQEFELQRRAEFEAEAAAWRSELSAARQAELEARERLEAASRQVDQEVSGFEAAKAEAKLRFGRQVSLSLLVQPRSQVTELRNTPTTTVERFDDQKGGGAAYRRMLGIVNTTLGPLTELADFADILHQNLTVYDVDGRPLPHLTFLQKLQRYAEGHRAEIHWNGLIMDLVVEFGQDAAIGYLSRYDRQMGEAMNRPVGVGAGWAL